MPASEELPSYQFTPVCQRVNPDQRANVTYELILRQQPKQSRMCGVGEKADRRPIDPPPIVQLIVKTPAAAGGSKSHNGFTSYLQNPYYFMHASLVEKDTPQDVLLIKDTRSKEDVNTIFKDNRTKATTGSSVSSLYPLKDFEDNGTESGFFVFPDLSVRMEGTYRLKFSLYEMVGKDVHFCAFVISEPLVVYSAKKFPGMEESTLLSQYFAEQGLKIRIRKEVRPKKRSRGEYLNAPASQSPTDSQHRDPAESQDEDEQASSTDMPLASKRRASGTRNIETRRDEPNVATLKDAMQASEAERRPSQSTRAGEGRSQAHDYSDDQAMPFTVDRPRSAPESHPQQQTYLEEGSLSFRHYSAANKAAEGVSHMDLSPGRSVGGSVRSEPRLDDYRIRAQDQSLASQERHISSPLPSRSGPTTSHRGTTRPVVGHESPMHDSNSLTSPTSPFARSTDIQPESALLKTKFASGQDFSGSYETGALAGPSHVRHGGGPSTDYHEDSRRGGRAATRRDSSVESPVAYDTRGTTIPPSHSRDHLSAPSYPTEDPSRTPHSQPFTRKLTPPETSYAYPSRQSYVGSSGQRSLEYGAPSYSDSHHRSSVASNTYDRSDYAKRPQGDPTSHAAPFHPPAQQHASYASREQHYMEAHSHSAQEQRSRHRSHHDQYSGSQQPKVSHSHPSAFGKRHGPDGVLARVLQAGPHGSLGKYPTGYTSSEEQAPMHRHYAPQGHPSLAVSSRDDQEVIRRESLGSSPPRPHDHRSQSLPHFAHPASGIPKAYASDNHSPTPPPPPPTTGYDSFHREHEGDIVSRYSAKSPPGYPAYPEPSTQAALARDPSIHYARGNSVVAKFLPHRLHESEPGIGQEAAPRPGLMEYSHDNRSKYGHDRSKSSATPRPPYSPTSNAGRTLHPRIAGVRAGNKSAGPAQSKGTGGRYDTYDDSQAPAQNSHYTSGHSPAPHVSEPYVTYSEASRSSMDYDYEHSPGHSVPAAHPYARLQSSSTPPSPPPPPPPPQQQQQRNPHAPLAHHSYPHYSESSASSHRSAPPAPHHPHSMPHHSYAHSHPQAHARVHPQGHTEIQGHGHGHKYGRIHAVQHGHVQTPLYLDQPHHAGSHSFSYTPSVVTQAEDAPRSRS